MREAVSAITLAALGPGHDPLNLVTLDGDLLAQDPGRLADELKSFGLFGGSRVVHVRATGRLPVSIIEAAAYDPAQDTLLIVEAGDLKRESALKTRCDKHRRIAALPFFADTARMISSLIDDMLRANTLLISRDARELLTAALGADRGLSRSELDKLAIYATGQREITAEMVLDCVSDAGRHETGALLDNAFAGNIAEIEPEANQIIASGTSPSAILSQAIGQVLMLRRGLRSMAGGASAEDYLSGIRAHFSRIPLLTRALHLWSDQRLEQALQSLADATAQTRRTPRLAGQITIRALWSAARRARRGQGR